MPQRQGIRVEGRLGDPDPVQAIRDALQGFAADEIQIITAPQRPSTWFRRNVIDRTRRSFEQPIKHVVMPTTKADTKRTSSSAFQHASRPESRDHPDDYGERR
ncbi:MAG TPA: hypothetical protein VFU10_01455 [Gaiellaceae bacterium]|nr:hypothetical protein [Gaiellaceae bacterium]